MSRFKKYERYKNANVNWIDSIPSHWDILPNRAIFSERITKNCADEQLLSVTIKNGVIKQTQLLEDSSKKDSSNEDKSKYKLVKINDIAYNKMRMWQGSVGFSEYQGIVSPAYIILKPHKNINSKYYHYLFRSPLYIQYSHNYSYGICDDQLSLRYKDFSTMYSIIPSIEEQEKIVQFIEYKEKQINKLIRKQKRLIELLQEKKKTIITEVVTKGLDKNAPMKDSGIEWVGKVPAHWRVIRTKYVATSFEKGNGITKDDVILDGDIQCIRYGEIYSKYDVKADKCFSRTNINKISSPKYIFNGDILFAGTGELVEEIGKNIVYTGNESCLAGGDIIILKHKQNAMFLNYSLNSNYAQSQKSFGKVKLKVVHISANNIGNIRIAIPPLEEQQKIVEYLDSKCFAINKIISGKENIITKLEEYKKSLISSAVTGQIDIRDYEIKDIIEDDTIEQVTEENNLSESEVEYANC